MSEHEWHYPIVRGTRSRQRRCGKCELWETTLSKAHLCGQSWPEDLTFEPAESTKDGTG